MACLSITLQANSYISSNIEQMCKTSLIKNCLSSENILATALLPYVKETTNRILRILKKQILWQSLHNSRSFTNTFEVQKLLYLWKVKGSNTSHANNVLKYTPNKRTNRVYQTKNKEQQRWNSPLTNNTENEPPSTKNKLSKQQDITDSNRQ